VTSVHFQVDKNSAAKTPVMFVTASLDGFIKMHSTGDQQTKKCFFVC